MSLERDLAAMQRIPFFAGFSEEQLKLLAFGSQAQKLQPGHVLFSAGQESDGGWVLIHGNVGLFKAGEENGQPSDVVSSETLIGARALFVETTRPSTAKVLAPSDFVFIPRDVFVRMLNEYPDLATSLEARLRSEVSALQQKMLGIGAKIKPAK